MAEKAVAVALEEEAWEAVAAAAATAAVATAVKEAGREVRAGD